MIAEAPLSESPTVRRKDSSGNALPGSGDAQRALSDARRWKHGPKTADGIERIRRASTTHGRRTQAAQQERRHVRLLVKEARALLTRLADGDR